MARYYFVPCKGEPWGEESFFLRKKVTKKGKVTWWRLPEEEEASYTNSWSELSSKTLWSPVTPADFKTYHRVLAAERAAWAEEMDALRKQYKKSRKKSKRSAKQLVPVDVR